MEKKSLKILYIITKSNFGGAQKYVFELATAAKAAGHDVTVACGGTGEAGAATGELVTRLQDHDIHIRFIRQFMRDMSVFKDIGAFFEILKILIKDRPDVVHLSSSKAGGIGALASRLVGISNILFTSHGLTIDETWRPIWQRMLIYVSTWGTFMLAHKTILINSENVERAKRMPFMKNKVVKIYNGVGDINFIPRKVAREQLAPEVPQQSLWIGGVGELHVNKNWSALLQAVTSLPKRVHVIIIGEGEERLKLEQQIANLHLQNNVHLVGYKHAAQYLKAFDIFVLPSKKEGLPYVVLEAGLASVPVIATNLPGLQDVIETGKHGLLVEPKSELLASALQMMVRDESMRRTYAEELHQRIASQFSIEQMFEKTLSLYSTNNS